MKKVSKQQLAMETTKDKPGMTGGPGSRRSLQPVLSVERVERSGEERADPEHGERFPAAFRGRGSSSHRAGVRHALALGQPVAQKSWPTGDRGQRTQDPRAHRRRVQERLQ